MLAPTGIKSWPHRSTYHVALAVAIAHLRPLTEIEDPTDLEMIETIEDFHAWMEILVYVIPRVPPVQRMEAMGMLHHIQAKMRSVIAQNESFPEEQRRIPPEIAEEWRRRLNGSYWPPGCGPRRGEH